ncbi:Lysine--tRNA ligase [Planctopirus limnophila DSM 3776]|uniref:Lysine--tRNA ligase n=1 Tax=Planctopirus limnophila (strain ATCC 43296 / DSM 3776 / IFAM 1008 / Mu 290) TaxID=521674 RepID=D5SQX7_PLAL2|nr:Lysine--tRNA ligase [Planctopirus limnophila DSM 3776]
MERTTDVLADDYLPSASMSLLKLRSSLMAAARQFFLQAGYWEVTTPILSSEMVLDSWSDPFITTDAVTERPLFLQTSPEAHMKRLLAAGSGPIFQFSRGFRKGDFGPRHNPEFTLLEWYFPEGELTDQIQFVENFIRLFFSEATRLRIQTAPRTHDFSRPVSSGRLLPSTAFERLTYSAAFERFLGLAALDVPVAELIAKARQLQLDLPGLDEDDRDGWLNDLLVNAIEPRLGFDRPVVLMDYPASQAGLATTRPLYPAGPEVANRFELYIDGVELCNGYHELTDPVELAHRAQTHARLREKAGLPPINPPQRLMSAMAANFPSATGVSLGFDRLVMLALGTSTIADVMSFAWDRA